MKDKKVFLTLQNGKVFEGYRFGGEGEIVGELVLSTLVTGFMDVITDPSNFGQIVAHTFPAVGNYGIIPEDAESDSPKISAYVMREKCDVPSNFRCEKTLEEYLKENGIVGVYGIDTRELTKIVREAGVMNAAITDEKVENFDRINEYSVKDAVSKVTSTKVEYLGDANGLKVVLYDLGVKKALLNDLINKGFNVIKVPANTSYDEVLSYNPDGVVISNGPGNPEDNVGLIKNVKKLLGKLPIFGIALGHQILALAAGCKTNKMKFGHRGGNQPVKNLEDNKVYITTQNHGYEVDIKSVENIGVVNFVNVNDGSCEGIDYPEYNAFSVQFYPKNANLIHDTSFLLNKFVAKMRKEK